MHRWVKSTLRDTPGLRELALRGRSLVRSLAYAEPGLYTLCYHRVERRYQDRFADQLCYLRRFGDFVDADTACERLAAGWPARDRAFLISFDDGHADTHDVAMPVLTALGAPAIVFLVSDWIDAPSDGGSGHPYMSRAQIGDWVAAGLQVGSHTRRHRQLSKLTREEVADELVGSRQTLAEMTGRQISHFACPWGVAERDFDPLHDTALAREAGYRTFFTTRRGTARGPGDLFLMPRHVIEPHWAAFQCEALLGGPKLGRRMHGTA